jgi:hypothetical protein
VLRTARASSSNWFGQGRGADEDELVAAGRLERNGVALDHIGADGGARRDLLGDVAEQL